MSNPVRMPSAVFFEEYPLYKKLWAAKYDDMPRSFELLGRPPISMACGPCGSKQTFRLSNQYAFDLPAQRLARVGPDPNKADAFRAVVRALYDCAACGWQRVFLLEFGPSKNQITNPNTVPLSYVAWVRKVGQSPKWTANLTREVEKALGSHLTYFERGLACEGEGFGLGALAYYRRVVEELVRRFSERRAATLTGADLDAFVAARDAARKEHSVKKEIDLVKDMVPADARPGNLNPLATLYTLCSEGMHLCDDEMHLGRQEDDEGDASDRVVKTRKALTALLQLLYSQEQAKAAASDILAVLK